MMFKHVSENYNRRTLFCLLIILFLGKSSLYAFDGPLSSPEPHNAILELKRKRLRKIWHETSSKSSEQRDIITHLVRKAYDCEYVIPSHANVLLKDEGFYTTQPDLLQAARDLFVLMDPKNPSVSDIKINV